MEACRQTVAAVAAFVLVVAAGALPATATPARPTRGGKLQVLVASDITPRTLVNALSPINVWVLGGVYETLTRYRLDRLEAQPILAESWQFSPDFTRITFRLRRGVQFHSGRPFTAADVRWNIERVADPRSASQLLNLARWVTRIETPDEHTVVVGFDRPRPSILDMFENLFIADRDTYQELLEGRRFVGTGPFTFKEWIPGDRYTLVRNPDFRRPDRPYLDEVVVRIVPDRQTQLIMLQTRSADLAINLDARTLKTLKQNPNYQVIIPPVWGTMWGIGIDVTAPPFADRRARHAVAYLVDRQRIVDTQLFFEEPIQLPWPKSSPAYFPDQASRYRYDFNRARALWAEVPGTASVSVPITVSTAYPETFGIAEVLQAELAKLGARATIEKLEHPQYVQRLAGARFNGLWSGIFGWINKNPSTLFVQSFAYRVPNAQNYDTPEYRQVLDAVLSATGRAQQARVYRRLNDLLLEEAFVLPVASANRPMGALARVEGVTLTRDTIPLLEEFWKSAR
jgi:peptide/nickel transport system substrate-binding protein